ncbi:Guanosine nucleotide diphosphate dissociation inhibitor 2 [Zea mays]|uniref:Guanosine nucleotide diphosphate dissociation inhibitor n=1 Tax=Zea mays TaxID=4577 RepID=A0A1D6ENE7_MAIZE|nr:Guanosine nucleotide diphosphate dissociation inhibitor 2 [Zea mays]
MDVEYDVIVLGTGLKECILSGLLSVDRLKVLHMDRNDYYGGDSTSLNLNQLWKRFKGEETPPAHIGASRDYNVDMVPKFMMANGTLVRVLIHTGVTKYMSFKAVDGSYVFNKGKIHKVPSTDMEALKSPLMGLFEKRRAGKFFLYVQDYKENDPSTHKGYNLTKLTTKELISWDSVYSNSYVLISFFRKYGLDDNTIDFIGHAVALHRDDSYLTEPAIDTVKRMKASLYSDILKISQHNSKVEFDDEGKVCGVTSEGETAKCKKVVCDPSYLPDKVKKIGKVFRAIAIMSHPIPNTAESHSVQIILPQKQLGRRSDMQVFLISSPRFIHYLLVYVFCCSYSHNVASKGKFIAFVSAQAETDNPEKELKPGIDLLGKVDELFIDIYDRYEPTNDSSADNCFISTSYDATTHFESTVMDVLSLYTKITGKTVDLSVDLSAASAAEDDM